MKKPFVYHENPSGEHSFLPAGDKWKIDLKRNIFAVADSATRMLTIYNREYPYESYGEQAAQIFCDAVVEKASEIIDVKKEITKKELHTIMKHANAKIDELNKKLGKKYDDPDNYDVAETVGAFGFIKDGKFYWGLIEDCYLDVMRGPALESKVEIQYQMMKSYKYMKETFDKDPDKYLTEKIKKILPREHSSEQFWSYFLKNNIELKDENGGLLGRGSFSGDPRAEKYFQAGIVDLKKGDQIVIFTDGMINVLQNEELYKWFTQNVENKFEFHHELRKKIMTTFEGVKAHDEEKTLIYTVYE